MTDQEADLNGDGGEELLDKSNSEMPVLDSKLSKTRCLKITTRKPVGFMQSCCFVFVGILRTYE